MSVTIKQRIDAERKLLRLVQLNDALVQQMAALAPLLDKIGSLPAGARAKLDEVLGAMGIDVADFDALIGALGVARTAIESELSLQQP